MAGRLLQNLKELAWFLDLLEREKVRSYLEVGSKFGDTLFKVGERLEVPSKIMAIDLPWGKKESQPILEANVARIKQQGHEVVLVLGDSTDPDIIERAYVEGPFDCVFIDANHTRAYVQSDWHHYGPLARIIAFHDISWVSRPGKSHMAIEVPQVWNAIKKEYRHEEMKLEPQDNGIGVLWRC